MSIDSDRARLSQKKTLEYLRRELKLTDMLPVYQRGVGVSDGIYCVAIPYAQIDRILSQPDWDFRPFESVPPVDMRQSGREEKAEYRRYGVSNGIEPLVIERKFPGLRNDYMEICEEFRLFHNLYHSKYKDKYIKIDKTGYEDTIAVVNPDCIRIRFKELLQYLAIKGMYLSIQFGYVEFSEHSLEELGFKEGASNHKDGLLHWRLLNYGGGKRSFSRLGGKRLVEPLPKSKRGFPEFAKEPEKEYVEFIIGVDENGDEIACTSDPDALANYFGANPDAPNYLTPVHFRKQVLDKYYQQPSKYTVGDSFLRCGELWVMDIDNHHNDKVCVWLGRIGQDLPYKEQLHWRTHNIPPAGGMSETYLKRQLHVQAMESDQPDLLFKECYHELRQACKEHLGWQLLQRLQPDDERHLQSLRIPATDEQRDFDELVLSLTKILIDSLHEKRLNTLLPDEQREQLTGGIARLEAVLVSRGVEGAAERIAFLRKLQSLRSSATAHRKGSKYQKIAKEFGIESQNLRDVFAGILWQALDLLNFFILLVGSGRVENVEENSIEEGYAILDELVGFVDAGATDGSVNHDDLIYELRTKP